MDVNYRKYSKFLFADHDENIVMTEKNRKRNLI